MFYNYQPKLSIQEYFEELKKVFKDECCSLDTVLYTKFCFNRIFQNTNFNKVVQEVLFFIIIKIISLRVMMIKEYSHVTVRTIHAILGIEMNAMNSI